MNDYIRPRTENGETKKKKSPRVNGVSNLVIISLEIFL